MVQSGRVVNFNRDALVSGDEPKLFDDIRIIPTETIATLNEERAGLISVDKFIKKTLAQQSLNVLFKFVAERYVFFTLIKFLQPVPI